MCLTVEWSSFQFMNLNLVLLRTKRKENWTFWGSPFSITIWLVYVIVGWPDQRPSTQNLPWNVIYNFGFEFQLVDQIFLQVVRKFLVQSVHQKFAFLTHLTAYTWIQNIS